MISVMFSAEACTSSGSINDIPKLLREGRASLRYGFAVAQLTGRRRCVKRRLKKYKVEVVSLLRGFQRTAPAELASCGHLFQASARIDGATRERSVSLRHVMELGNHQERCE